MYKWLLVAGDDMKSMSWPQTVFEKGKVKALEGSRCSGMTQHGRTEQVTKYRLWLLSRKTQTEAHWSRNGAIKELIHSQLTSLSKWGKLCWAKHLWKLPSTGGMFGTAQPLCADQMLNKECPSKHLQQSADWPQGAAAALTAAEAMFALLFCYNSAQADRTNALDKDHF